MKTVIKRRAKQEIPQFPAGKRTFLKLVLTILMAVILSLPQLHGQTGYTQIDYPSSIDTRVNGVSGANVVGEYNDNTITHALHGFLYNSGNYTSLDPSGLGGASATAVSGSNVVGHYTDSSGVSFGFIYNGVAFVTFSVVATGDTFDNGTYPTAVSGNNVVGSFLDDCIAGRNEFFWSSLIPIPPGRRFGFCFIPAPPLFISKCPKVFIALAKKNMKKFRQAVLRHLRS